MPRSRISSQSAEKLTSAELRHICGWTLWLLPVKILRWQYRLCKGQLSGCGSTLQLDHLYKLVEIALYPYYISALMVIHRVVVGCKFLHLTERTLTSVRILSLILVVWTCLLLDGDRVSCDHNSPLVLVLFGLDRNAKASSQVADKKELVCLYRKLRRCWAV